MAKIELYFGTPFFDKGINQNERWALNHEISIEKANIDSFNSVMKVLTRFNEDHQTYLSLCFTSIAGADFSTPKIKTGSYTLNRNKFPKLVIEGDHLIDKESKKQIFIEDHFIEKIGQYVEEDFDYEFVGFKRSGKMKIGKDEITYLINSKPHLCHNGKFFEIKK
ncbi:hypothetical protein G6681_05565 [Polynucleobacter paneuropaeus]|nr:hypothetical protein G6681_05565 [Polynucleobacter paneuropaeus]